MKSILLKLLPHAVAIIIFVIVSSLIFSMENDDYTLRQSDIEHVMGMSKELVDYRLMNDGQEALWSNNMFGGMPAYQTNVLYPSNLLRKIDSLIKLYQDPATGTIFMCMLGFYIFCLCMRINPWLGIAGGLAFGLSTINVLYLGAGHTSKINAVAYMAPTLGGLLLAFRGKWLSGAAVFALFFGLHVAATHLQMTYYLAFLLGIVSLGEIIRLIVRKNAGYAAKASGALLVALVLGVLPNLGSLLTTYEYSKLTTRGKTDLTITAEGTVTEEGQQDGLAADYILQYNMSGREWMAAFLPNAKGGSSGYLNADKKAMQLAGKQPKEMKEQLGQENHYWGDQDASAGAFYFGAFMMFIFAVALIFSKDHIRWPFLVLTILVIALSARELTGINNFFISDIPFYNKFRDHKMMLVLLQLMAPALALIFIDDLMRTQLNAKSRKYLLIGTGALLVIGISICMVPTSAAKLLSAREAKMYDDARDENKDKPAVIDNIDSYLETLSAVRARIYRQDGQRSMVLFLFAAAMVAVAAMRWLHWYYIIPILTVIVTADIWSVSTRYMNEDKRSGQYLHYVKTGDKFFPFTPDACDLAILEKEKSSIPDFELEASALQEKYLSTTPYNKVKDKKKHEAAAPFGTLQLNTNYRVLLASRGVFTDASIPYFHKSIGGYHAAKLKRYQEMIDFYLTPEIGTLTEAMQSRDLRVVDSTLTTLKVLNMLNTRYVKFSAEAPPLENRGAMGNAWFVDNINIVGSANEEMEAIGDLDPRRIAVVHSEFADIAHSGSIDSTATVVLDTYGTSSQAYTTHTNAEAPLIFSEIYYPEGWVCRIDNTEVPYFRANYFLRGVMVPAGDHKIEWSFEPASYKKGVMVNWIGSILLIIALLAVAFLAYRRYRAAELRTVSS